MHIIDRGQGSPVLQTFNKAHNQIPLRFVCVFHQSPMDIYTWGMQRPSA